MNKKLFVTYSFIFILSCLLMIFASVAKKYRTKIEWDGNTYNIENVNSIDAKFARPYNKLLDKTADCLVVLSFMIPCLLIMFTFFADPDKKKAFREAFFDCYTYCVCVFYANGIYRVLKTFAGRIRPYMYFLNPSEKGIAKGDFYRSWPSGHSANVFIAFAFMLVWFSIRKADVKYKKPVISASFLICLVTMILRMLSGNHFLTDVISGAAIGFVFSYLTALMCKSLYKKNKFWEEK